MNHVHPSRFSKLIFYCIACFLLMTAQLGSWAAPGTIPPTAAKMASLQQAAKLLFTENLGQVMDDKGKPRPDVLFTAHSGGTQVFLTATGISYQFTKITYPPGYDTKDRTGSRKQAELAEDIKRETYKFSLTLAGANGNPVVRKELKNTYTENFYTTGCLDGITNVGTYERVVYQDVYPHIDWVVYSNGNKLKYDFLVHPGGDPKQIKLQIDDAQSVQITDVGELVMKTTLGEVREQAPVSYAGDAVVSTAFRRNSDGSMGFDVGAYSGELRIDPSVVWATYYGGSGEDLFYGCTTDMSGNFYATGNTASASGIASASGYQTSLNVFNDAMLVKFDSSGVMQWATYYGGSAFDYGQACATDSQGYVYMAGYSSSPGLATVNAFDTLNNGSESALLVKFSATGTRIWATYFGLISTYGYSCKTDKAGNIYLSGATGSKFDIATPGAYQTVHGSDGGDYDCFLAKFNPSGNRLWATFYGGSGGDVAGLIGIDDSANIYLAGFTDSHDGIATTGCYQHAENGGEDIFLTKFDSSGAHKWGTYYGGYGDEMIYYNGLDVDDSGNIYIAGETSSGSFMTTPGTYQPAYSAAPSGDAFLAKFNRNGSRVWGTYYGSNNYQLAYSVAADHFHNIYIAGSTSGTSGIATPGAYQTMLGGNRDGFVAKFTDSGTRLWGTYFGGSGTDIFYGSTIDRNGNLYIVGETFTDSGIALPNGYQIQYGGAGDGLVLRIGAVPPIFTDSILRSHLCAGDTISIPFTTTDTFQSNNIFTAQLSDNQGSFTSPTVIGTLASPLAGAILATIPASLSPGTHYRVRVVASNPVVAGMSNYNDIVIDTVVQVLVSILPAPSDTICMGTAVSFTAAGSNAGNTPVYKWLKNGVPVGVNNSGYTDAALNDKDSISCILISSAACAVPVRDTAKSIVMTVKVQPVPIINYMGDVLCVATYAHYQWYLNGNQITGDTTMCTNHTQGGDYTVQVTNADGCMGMSAVYHLATGINTITAQQITLFPNPATTVVSVAAPERVNVSINTIDGRQLLYKENAITIDLYDLPNAVYVIKIYNGNNVLLKVEKLVKTGL